MAPLLDLLITLLHWGAAGWRRELQQREELQPLVLEALKQCAAEIGERVLMTPENPISMGMTLDSLENAPNNTSNKNENSSGKTASAPILAGGGAAGSATFLGSMLFARGASGARVIVPGKQQTVAGVHFQSYGASYDRYPHAYVTVAAAIGSSTKDIEEFLKRLRSCVDEFKRKKMKNTSVKTDDIVKIDNVSTD